MISTSPQDPASAQATAERVRVAMLEHDHATRHMGIEIVQVGPGSATATMTVQRWMLNGHATCHGGFITTLADSAFAFACNSYNHVTVAAGCSIEFLKSARLGDVLTCEGVEQTRAGRHGIYDMRVTNQQGETIALFRGKSAQIQGTVIPE